MNTNKGFAALYLVLITLGFMAAITTSSFLLVFSQQRTWRNTQHSVQAYWAAEAGVEDALLRLQKGMSWTNPISLSAGAGTASTTITETSPGTNLVVAQGNAASRVRKIQALFELSGTTPAFFYGAHIGAGGLQMDNLSRVIGNVFSNGSIQASSGTQITGTATVAGPANTITNASITQDAYVQSCVNSSMGATLHAATQSGCMFGSFTTSGIPVSPVALPITQAEIDQLKQDALAGGVISGNYELSGTESATLGPKKIQGNLTIQSSAQLTLTGTLWVTGSIDVKNSARVKLAASYGSSSGILVSDGEITIQNNSVSSGSGQAGSYLMYLSTFSFQDAITIKNNAILDAVYTSQGGITIENNLQLKEATGYSIHLKNNAEIIYELGLRDARFTSGPGASFELSSWQEVE